MLIGLLRRLQTSPISALTTLLTVGIATLAVVLLTQQSAPQARRRDYRRPSPKDASLARRPDSQELRQQTILETCQKYPFVREFPQNLDNDSRIYFDRQRRFLYCEVSKVASTTWLDHLNTLAGPEWRQKYKKMGMPIYSRTSNHSFRKFLKRKRFSLPKNISTVEAFRQFYSFMFVRNPFSRLVSAYDQKIARPKSEVRLTLKGVWQQIMDQRRSSNKDAGKKRATNSSHPTPEEFVDYLLKVYRQGKVAQLEHHFQPHWVSCPLCKVNFTFIGKVESFKEDARKVLRRLGVLKLDASRHANSHTGSQRKQSGNRQELFFSRVPKEKIRELYHLYKIDFDLFGYPAPDYDIK